MGRGHAERMRFISFFRKGDSIFPDQQVDVYTVTDRIGRRFNRRMSVVYRLHDSELIFHVEDRLNGFTSAVVALPARDLHHRPYFRDWMEELILPGAIFLAPFSGR